MDFVTINITDNVTNITASPVAPEEAVYPMPLRYVFIVLATIGLILNSAALAFISLAPSLKKPLKILIKSQVISCILILLGFAIYALYKLEEKRDSMLCYPVFIMVTATVTTNQFSVALFAVLNFICVLRPIAFSSSLTSSKVFILVLSVWVTSVFMSVCTYGLKLGDGYCISVLYLKRPGFVLLCLTWSVSSTSVVVFNTLTICLLRKTTKTVPYKSGDKQTIWKTRASNSRGKYQNRPSNAAGRKTKSFRPFLENFSSISDDGTGPIRYYNKKVHCAQQRQSRCHSAACNPCRHFIICNEQTQMEFLDVLQLRRHEIGYNNSFPLPENTHRVNATASYHGKTLRSPPLRHKKITVIKRARPNFPSQCKHTNYKICEESSLPLPLGSALCAKKSVGVRRYSEPAIRNVTSSFNCTKSTSQPDDVPRIDELRLSEEDSRTVSYSSQVSCNWRSPHNKKKVKIIVTLMILSMWSLALGLPFTIYMIWRSTQPPLVSASATRAHRWTTTFILLGCLGNTFMYAWRFLSLRQIRLNLQLWCTCL